MNKEIFIDSVSKKLCIKKSAIAKKKYGLSPEITYEELLGAIYEQETIPNIAKRLQLSIRTTNRLLNEYALSSVQKVEGKPWKARLLELVDFKTCNVCKCTKPTSEFYLLPSNSMASKNRSGFMYRCKNCDKIHTLEKYEFYPYIHRAANNKYRALKNNPNSMKGCDLSLVTLIYKNCPEGFVVDHIIPLSKGGGHNEFNLCYLTVKDNMIKGSKLPDEVAELMTRAIFPDF